MARDRKRAKQRQRRRSPQRPPARVPAPAPEPEAAPEPLEHSSGEVDLAEAAIVDPPEARLEAEELPQDDELDADEEHVAAEDALQEPELETAAERGGEGRAAAVAATGRAPGSELPKEGNRLLNFLRACVAELRRVQWPDRRQVTQATGVVLGFVILAGTYLGLLDAAFSRLVGAIL
jgi:preprotein translocase SecE subunit